MKRFRVVLEQPARDDIERYYRRAMVAGAELNAARWYNRIVDAILALEDVPEWRPSIPEQDEFPEKLYQVVFESRYRIIYAVVEDRVHILCVRGPGMRELAPSDVSWPTH